MVIVKTVDIWHSENQAKRNEANSFSDFYYCFAGTHNSTTGFYAGMLIMPSTLPTLYVILEQQKKWINSDSEIVYHEKN
jgi:hypothetical protein